MNNIISFSIVEKGLEMPHGLSLALTRMDFITDEKLRFLTLKMLSSLDRFQENNKKINFGIHPSNENDVVILTNIVGPMNENLSFTLNKDETIHFGENFYAFNDLSSMNKNELDELVYKYLVTGETYGVFVNTSPIC